MSTHRFSTTKGRNLHAVAVAFRNGDQKAGWEFATSPQIEATITRLVGAYARRPFAREEDLEDLRSDLRIRVMERLADPTFDLPCYKEPHLNEAALVTYFGRAMMDLAQRAIQQIIGPMRSRRTASGKRTLEPAIQIPFGSDPDMPRNKDDPDGRVDERVLDPVEAMDRARRLRILANAKRYFSNDDEARTGFSALFHHASGIEEWEDIAQIVGLGESHGRIARGLAMRWRNVLKAAMIENGEDVGYSILGVYTSIRESGVCLLTSGGKMETWTLPAITVMSPEALSNRIVKVLKANVVTFAALNMDDHSSPMRMATMRALHHREPLTERWDISWLESYVSDGVAGFRRFGDAKRRAMLLAHAKLAECQLKHEAGSKP